MRACYPNRLDYMGAENSLFGFPKKTILVSRKQTEMPIDINLLRSFKGGITDIVKLSQKNRFKDVSIVDRVISQDEVFFILIINL